MERRDPAYPGKTGDMTTTSWSRLDADILAEVLREEEDAEYEPLRRYRGRHRKPGDTTPRGWPAISR
jgi:hypothetical protein